MNIASSSVLITIADIAGGRVSRFVFEPVRRFGKPFFLLVFYTISTQSGVERYRPGFSNMLIFGSPMRTYRDPAVVTSE